MIASGDTTITPRMVLDSGWRLVIHCTDCNNSVGPPLRMAPWPVVYDVPLVQLFSRLRCSTPVNRGGRVVPCRAKTSRLEVSRIVGNGSRFETLLDVTERGG